MYFVVDIVLNFRTPFYDAQGRLVYNSTEMAKNYLKGWLLIDIGSCASLLQYIFLLTLAIVFFAISRSFGHLVKQVLLLNDMPDIWKQISPFSGAINSAIFIIIFAFSWRVSYPNIISFYTQ